MSLFSFFSFESTSLAQLCLVLSVCGASDDATGEKNTSLISIRLFYPDSKFNEEKETTFGGDKMSKEVHFDVKC